MNKVNCIYLNESGFCTHEKAKKYSYESRICLLTKVNKMTCWHKKEKKDEQTRN